MLTRVPLFPLPSHRAGSGPETKASVLLLSRVACTSSQQSAPSAQTSTCGWCAPPAASACHRPSGDKCLPRITLAQSVLLEFSLESALEVYTNGLSG